MSYNSIMIHWAKGWLVTSLMVSSPFSFSVGTLLSCLYMRGTGGSVEYEDFVRPKGSHGQDEYSTAFHTPATLLLI